MPEDNVVRIKNDLYQKAKELAEAEGISIADAVTKLVDAGGAQPTTCELLQFRSVLEDRGLTAPKRADWVWGVTDVLPADMLTGTKLGPYAEARQEAELRCELGDQLYDKMIGDLGSEEAVEQAIDEAVAEQSETISELEPALSIDASLKAEAGGEVEVEASPPAEAEPAEPIVQEEEV